MFIGRYKVTGELGRGGMGVVYRGEDPRLERPVAIKVLAGRTSERDIERFRREARLCARLDHEGILKILDFGDEGSKCHIVMELVEGVTLREMLAASSLDVAETVRVFGMICAAVEYAHACGVTHRDLKPDNIMVTTRSGRWEPATSRIKVMDFGLAVLENHHSLTAQGAIMGTLTYFSPEQARGERADARSDIYSLGIVLFEMLTGRVPFRGAHAAELIRHHLESPPPSLRDLNKAVPEAIERVVLRCMRKLPDERFQSLTEVRQALAGAVGPSAARPAETAEAAAAPAASSPPAAPAAAAPAASPPAASDALLGVCEFTSPEGEKYAAYIGRQVESLVLHDARLRALIDRLRSQQARWRVEFAAGGSAEPETAVTGPGAVSTRLRNNAGFTAWEIWFHLAAELVRAVLLLGGAASGTDAERLRLEACCRRAALAALKRRACPADALAATPLAELATFLDLGDGPVPEGRWSDFLAIVWKSMHPGARFPGTVAQAAAAIPTELPGASRPSPSAEARALARVDLAGWRDIADRCAVIGLARHLAFQEAVSGRSCRFDLEAARFVVEGLGDFEAHLLGTASADTFTWSWASPQAGLPVCTAAARRLRDHGRKAGGLGVLTEPSLSASQVNPLELAAVCCELMRDDAFWVVRDSHDAMFLLVSGAPADIRHRDIAAIGRVIELAIGHLGVGHRRIVETLLEQQGFALECTADAIVGTRDGSVVIARLEGDRLVQFGETSAASPKPATADAGGGSAASAPPRPASASPALAPIPPAVNAAAARPAPSAPVPRPAPANAATPKPAAPTPPDPPDALVQRGQALHKAGDVAGARAAYEAALRADPRCYGALVQLGRIERDAKSWAAAEERLRAAHAARPEKDYPLYLLVSVLEGRGRVDEALEMAERSVAAAPSDAYNVAQLARLLRRLGRLAEAIPKMKQAVELKPDDASLQGTLARMLAEQAPAAQAAPAITLPIRVHHVHNAKHGLTAKCAAGLDKLLCDVADIWKAAGIALEFTRIETQLSTEAIEAAFPDRASDPPATPRKVSAQGLKACGEWSAQAVNLFVIDFVRTIGARDMGHTYYSGFRGDATALCGVAWSKGSAHHVARAIGFVLGLGKNADAATLMNGGGGTAITADEGAKAQSAVEKLRARFAAADEPPPEADAASRDLDALVGLATARKKISSMVSYARAEVLRRERLKLATPLNLHAVFRGQIGTGKSTAATLLGRMYRAIGALPSGHVVEASIRVFQSDPVYYFKKAAGGLLVLDQPYRPGATPDLDGYGRAVAAMLKKQLDTAPDRFAVVISGARSDMDSFLQSNPLIASLLRNVVDFEPFTMSDMLDMFLHFGQGRLRVDEAARAALAETFEKALGQADEGFANARYVRRVFDDTLERQATRLMSVPAPSDDDLVTILAADVPGHTAGPAVQKRGRGWDPANVRVAEPPDGESLDDILADLDRLVGLNEVKQQIRALASHLAVQQRRRAQGLATPPLTLHMAFLGPPGTGKTTVARFMGRIFKCLGMLGRGHLVETDQSGLIAAYLGQTALKTNQAVDNALHGVLFVDEAYSLAEGRDYGKEAVSVLLKRMEDDRERLSVIVAGYADRMESFFRMNPGLRSRFVEMVSFPDYTPDELTEIFRRLCEGAGYRPDESAITEAAKRLARAWQQRGDDFANGRLVRNLFEASLKKQATRVAAAPDADVAALTAADIGELAATPILADALFKVAERPEDDSLEQVMRELDALVGLDGVKERIRTLVNLMRVEARRIEQGGAASDVTLHLVFSGAPGTGKTTVARLLGRIYRCLGRLSRGHLVETDRAGLVDYPRTAARVRDIVDVARNGVLFVDEAYMLTESDDSQGREAVGALVKCMEDERGRLAVIAAGYPEAMRLFLEANAGLRSRFPAPLEFADYDVPQLLQIFDAFCRPARFTLEGSARDKLERLLRDAWERRTETFGNARLVRQVLELAVQRQANRVADNEDAAALNVFTAADIPDALPSDGGKARIGFRR